MKKRATAYLIPYYLQEGDLFVFLQRRIADDRLPNQLAAFGGQLEEGETYEQALVREIGEELEYTTENYKELGPFEDDFATSVAYIEQVPENFAEQVVVHEGKGGEWHKATEVITRDDIHAKTRETVVAMINTLV